MFVIAEPISGSVCTPTGEVEFDLEPGEHTPTTPDDVAVFGFLARIGAAVQDTKPRPRRSTKQGE